MTPPRPILVLNQLTKSFPGDKGSVEALSPTTLTIQEGEFVCILGASGCGKSTLLNIVAGLDPHTSGSIEFKGKPLAGTGPDRVMLFQEATLFPWLNVLDNVAFGLRAKGLTQAERYATAQDWISRVHLGGFETHYPHELSGGMRQRAALARAFSITPDMMLMDEPFCALDALTRDVLHHELESLWLSSRKTVLFVTHNVREAIALGDRVLVMSPRPGRIVADLRITLPRSRSLEDPLVTMNAATALAALQGKLPEFEEASI